MDSPRNEEARHRNSFLNCQCTFRHERESDLTLKTRVSTKRGHRFSTEKLHVNRGGSRFLC